MTYKLVVTGDTYDCDYITKTTDIDLADVALITSLIKAIKNAGEHNYPTTEIDLFDKSAHDLYKNYPYFDFFDSFVPYGDYGIHTIKEIILLEINDEIKLL